jgi:DNA-binding transcriptional regulator YiaG
MKTKMLRYTDGGLKNVWLQNGFEIRKTPHGKGVAIHDVDGLTQAICSALTSKSCSLTGLEFRYIRNGGMLLSQAGLAAMMGVDAQTVARWEKHGRLPKWADKMIRLLFMAHTDGDQAISLVMARISAVERLINQKIVVREVRNKGWRSDLVDAGKVLT